MIRDFTEARPEGRYDVCIVGTGPAGIALALKMGRANRRVLLLEGGDLEPSQRSRDVYRGNITGDPYYALDESRLRFFGGTSNHWSGWCHPLDDFDFEAKAYRPLASWPITKDDLDPYLDECRELLGLGEFVDDLLLSESLRQTEFNVRPVRFRSAFGDAIEKSENIDLYTNANATLIRTNGNRVEQIEAATWTDLSAGIVADNYVLAMGGIENSRLLLWSNEQANGALLPAVSPIGRYWMDTPVAGIGQAVVFDDDPFSRMGPYAFLNPTREALLDDEILNCGLYFRPISYSGAREIIADLACVAPETARRVARRLGRDLYCGYMMEAHLAQEPLEASRVELNAEKDRFGVPRVNLHWQKSSYDIRTARRAAERLGEFMVERDLGRVHLDTWVIEENAFPEDAVVGSHHHMGGTRMAGSAETGVVDRNCRVFGQENLYVAGSSIFPVGGYVNPTFTILQLATRLGDHLSRV